MKCSCSGDTWLPGLSVTVTFELLTSIQTFLESESHMTHVVAEPCFNCKYTDCVTVCPVECFYEGEAMLFIHPEECIDCEACVPECPPAAIFHEDNLPAEWSDYTALNAEMAPNCPVITERKDPMGPPIEGKGGH